jgi:hypothetical protein
MKTPRLRASLHMHVLICLLMIYVLAVLTMWATPHRFSGFSRLHAHQLYAALGCMATFGAVDRMLRDYYMRGPTMEQNAPLYDRYI